MIRRKLAQKAPFGFNNKNQYTYEEEEEDEDENEEVEEMPINISSEDGNQAYQVDYTSITEDFFEDF